MQYKLKYFYANRGGNIVYTWVLFYARFYNQRLYIVSKKQRHSNEMLPRHIEHINVSACEICLQLSKENCGDIVPAQRVQAHDKNFFILNRICS